MAAKASFKQAILRVLATAPAAPCYEALLAQDPRAYGEVVVRFTVLADGSVPESEVLFATLSDAPAEACVAGVVKTLAFPGVTQAPISVVYPFLFTSDATPMEVARALKVRYGLLPPEPPGDPTNPREVTPPGVVYLW